MAYYDDINNKKVLAVGVWGFLITLICVILLQAAYYQQKYNVDEKNASEYPATVKYLEEQQEQLEGNKWIDKEKGIMGISIEKAKTDVLKQLQKTKTPKTALLGQ